MLRYNYTIYEYTLIYLSIYLSLSLSMYIIMYIYIYIYVCMCVYTYIYIYIHIYTYIYIYIYIWPCRGDWRRAPPVPVEVDPSHTLPAAGSCGRVTKDTQSRCPRVFRGGVFAAKIRTKIMDFRGLDSSITLIQRVGIPRPTGNFPENLSQAILVGIILKGRLGVWLRLTARMVGEGRRCFER